MSGFTGEYIWIIGASSGIGAALARELHVQGATLILSARRLVELERLSEELGGHHMVYPLDVADGQAVLTSAREIALQVGHVDRVIFLAAILRPANIDKMDIHFAKELVEVNVLGGIYTSYAVLPLFEKQRHGQIALCGSIAGYTGLPGGQPYSATKAAIANFTESLYAEVEDYIDVKLISPGFVRTRITDKNGFTMPMLLEPEQAAQAIAKGLKAKPFEIHFPKSFTFAVKFLRWLPYCVTLLITRRLRGKA